MDINVQNSLWIYEIILKSLKSNSIYSFILKKTGNFSFNMFCWYVAYLCSGGAFIIEDNMNGNPWISVAWQP